MAGAALLACAVTQVAVPSAAQVTGHAHRIRGAAAVLYSWGNNFSGQLGTGAPLRTTAPTPAKVLLPPEMTPTAVAGGSTFAFAAGLGGAVYAWGDNLHGQLATGSIGKPSPVPVKVSLPDGVSALSVAAGDSSAYVIGSDGKLYDWGNNKSGQLGIGSTKSRYRPGTVQLPDGAQPYAIAAGKFSAYAIGSNGVLYSWGQNEAGQLGNNSITPSTTPVRVALPPDVIPVKIAAGQSAAYVLASNGTVYAWGDNHVGQLGNSMVGVYGSLVPVRVFLPTDVTPTALASGLNSAYVLTKDGLIYAWGANGEGQLGDGTRDNRLVPVRVSLPAGVQPVQIVAGAISAYAMGATGKLYAWGNNVFGQLGNGTTQGVLVPTLIPLPAGVAAAALVPESGSTSAYLITAPGGRKRPLNFTKTGRLTWFVDGPGPTVKIQGGGGGPDHSNCVSDTTDKTVEAFADPTHSSVFIDPTDSGSCAFEASFSYFTITVTGFNADAKRVNATGRIWLGQDAAGSDYYEKCALPLDHMTCREVNRLEVEIVAQPEGRAVRHTLPTK